MVEPRAGGRGAAKLVSGRCRAVVTYRALEQELEEELEVGMEASPEPSACFRISP